MIDTDKYTGHTEGPWRIVKPHHANETGHIWCIESDGVVDYALHHPTRIAHICVIDNEDDDSINAQLIADVPLLLEEVKRLREENESLRLNIMGQPSEQWMLFPYEETQRLHAKHDSSLAEVKRLREVMIHVEQRQPHPALEWALKEGLTLAEIMERVE